MKKIPLALVMFFVMCSLACGQIKMTIVDSANQPILQGTLWSLNMDGTSMTMQIMLKESKAELLKNVCPVCPPVTPGNVGAVIIDGAPVSIATFSLAITTISSTPIPPPAAKYSCASGVCSVNASGAYTSLAACQVACMVSPNNPCSGTLVAQPVGTFPTIPFGPKPTSKDQLIPYLKANTGTSGICPWLVWAQQSQTNLDWVWSKTPYGKASIKRRWWQSPK